MSRVKGENPVSMETVAEKAKRITLAIVGKIVGTLTGKYVCAERPKDDSLYSQGITDSANFDRNGKFLGVDCMGIAPNGEAVKYSLSADSMEYVFTESGVKLYVSVKFWPESILTRAQYRAKRDAK